MRVLLRNIYDTFTSALRGSCSHHEHCSLCPAVSPGGEGRAVPEPAAELGGLMDTGLGQGRGAGNSRRWGGFHPYVLPSSSTSLSPGWVPVWPRCGAAAWEVLEAPCPKFPGCCSSCTDAAGSSCGPAPRLTCPGQRKRGRSLLPAASVDPRCFPNNIQMDPQKSFASQKKKKKKKSTSAAG